MSDKMNFDDLLRKIADDTDFMVTLAHDPKKALESAGIHPTDEMINAIKGVDKKSIQAVANAFGTGGVHADTFAVC